MGFAYQSKAEYKKEVARMRVAILGCGAMGTVLGAYMTKMGAMWS